jgi:hypothetical protein
LLLVVLLISGWLGWNVSRYRAEQAAVQWITQRFASAEVVWVHPFWMPGDGRTIFSGVERVAISDDRLDDAMLRALPVEEFHSLVVVELACPSIDLATFTELSNRAPRAQFEAVVFGELVKDTIDPAEIRALHGQARD